MNSENTIRIANDLGTWILFPEKNSRETIYLVGSVHADKYLVVPSNRYPLVMQIIESLREGLNPDQIEKKLLSQKLIVNVVEFCKTLSQKKIIEWEDGDEVKDEPNATPSLWSSLFGHLRALSWDIFSIQLSSKYLENKKRNALILNLVLVSILVTGYLISLNDPSLLNKTAVWEIIRSKGIIWIFILNLLMMPFFILFHEGLHAVAAAIGGVFPRKLTMRIYMFIVPYFSLQVPGLYTLPFKQRMTAIAAGPMADLLLGNIFLLGALNAPAAISPWLTFGVLSCYGRFIYNVLPILPMTDGYAILSQALFHEIDIRGTATQEFRRWKQKKHNKFNNKYAAFFILNVLFVAGLIGIFLFQLNDWILKWIFNSPLWHFSSSWRIAVTIVVDMTFLYMIRKRLKALLGL